MYIVTMLMNRCFPWVSFAYVKDMPIWVVIWGLITEWLFHKKGLIILVPGNEELRLEKQITCENWGFFTVYRCLSSFLFKSLYKSHLLVARSYVAISTSWLHFPRSNTSMRLTNLWKHEFFFQDLKPWAEYSFFFCTRYFIELNII